MKEKENKETKETTETKELAEKVNKYTSTLNMPKTDFNMKANLKEKEPFLIEKMEMLQTYNKLEKKNNMKKYILHDGPPYVYEDVNLGTVLNKVLKDIILRYKNMNGYFTPFMPGWDTHGLPIEEKIKSTEKFKNVIELRDKCKAYVVNQIEKEVPIYKRLGTIANYTNSYLTLDPKIEAKQIETFYKLYKDGYIIRDVKPITWCKDCNKTLANKEVERVEENAKCMYVKYKIKESLLENKNTYFVTVVDEAWKVIGSVAVGIKEKLKYCLIETEKEGYIVSKNNLISFTRACKIKKYDEIKDVKVSDILKFKYVNPLVERIGEVISLKDDSFMDKTGIINLVPGHVREDYLEYKKAISKSIDIIIDQNGITTEKAGMYANMTYYDASKKAEIFLKEIKYVIGEVNERIIKKHCSKCMQPCFEVGRLQWFLDIDKIRKELLESIKQVKWHPEVMQEHMKDMVNKREEWCVSRQRKWGVPIPVFYCEKCGKEYITDDLIKKVKELVLEKGSNQWYKLDDKDLLDKDAVCEKCGNNKFRKEEDIMDIWLDSGLTHETVLKVASRDNFPADMYLEGKDQIRGWLQASLITSVALNKKAPYRHALVHGFVVDKDGKRLDKNNENYITAEEIINEYGADILRLWTVYSDYYKDIKVSKEILNQVAEVYKKIRNVSRFMLGNLKDFNPDKEYKFIDSRSKLDRYALLKLNQLIQKVNKAYEKYDFHIAFLMMYEFYLKISIEYLDSVKLDLYTLKQDSDERRAIQSTIYDIILKVTKLISPILCFLGEEIWAYLNVKEKDRAEEIVLSNWPELNIKSLDLEVEKTFNILFKYKEKVQKEVNYLIKENYLKTSKDAKIIINDKENNDLLSENIDTLIKILGVSDVEIDKDLKKDLKAIKADGDKCERCNLRSITVGKNREHLDLCKKCIDNLYNNKN